MKTDSCKIVSRWTAFEKQPTGVVRKRAAYLSRRRLCPNQPV